MFRTPVALGVAVVLVGLAGCVFDLPGGGSRTGITPAPIANFSPLPQVSPGTGGSGTGGQTGGGDNIGLQGVTTLAGSGILGSLRNPRGVAVDAQGRVAIADTRDHRIAVVTSAGAEAILAGSGLAGWVDGTGSQAQFTFPNAVAFEASGSLLVADTDNFQIRRVFADGRVSAFAGDGRRGIVDGPSSSAGFDAPVGLAIDGSGNVFVSEQNGNIIRKISTAGVVSTFAGSGTPGGADGTGPEATFNRPFGLATDAAGNLLVADTDSHKIRRITPAGEVTTIAGSGEAGDTNGAALQARFQFPRGVAVDSLARVFVADSGNHSIRLIGTDSSVSTVAGGSGRGFSDGTLAAAQFDEPSGLAVDDRHRVYVADYGNHRIRVVVP